MSFFQKLSVRISPKPKGSNSNSTCSNSISTSFIENNNNLSTKNMLQTKVYTNSTNSNNNSYNDINKKKSSTHNTIIIPSSPQQPNTHSHQTSSMLEESNTPPPPLPVNEKSTSSSNNHVQQNSRHPLEISMTSSTINLKLSLNNFDLCRTLGTGSFGRVHLVQSKHNQKFYAMKVLKKSEVVRLKQVEHTNNEKRILEQTSHPFMVKLWGTFQDSANLYMVMDYVVGGELFSVLRKTQRFPDHVAKFYASEVLLAFEFLHSKDIIYRDLKPENLLLDRNGHIKITDFGFAKHVPDVTWTLCGTPDYLAPEVIQSKGYSKAVDWYSLGVLIFEMLAGYPPFYDEDHMRLYEKIVAGRVKYPSFFESVVKDLLKRLLTADLSKRYGNLKGGSEDIKQHNWFKGVDWERLCRQEIEAPYIPHVNGDGDTSNFDMYPEEQESYGKPCSDIYRDKFPTF
ncbi:12141_t:CDS:2 [Ambispora gerdemannii]|uniref:cAMP-dependent protein kinase n=1 Tax=Ambispora gerdemannii TaxID=144530 RepID=A0A9N8YIG4_9GLOM|nr:12141_t:CDS:2 [Ambispora gerdemannii]